MSEPFIGEIRMFAGNFPPVNWALCQGQLQAISQNDALFALLGTTYGGDGQTTFGLPDLRGRVPVHSGQGSGLSTYVQGQVGGVTDVTLTSNQMPSHTHAPMASTNAGTAVAPSASVVPATPVDNLAFPTFYVVPGTSTITPTPMAATSISNAGGSQSHTNQMPYLGLNFIIALYGIFPTRN
jgi:microcystin-dependent protein